ncbi:MAG: hypothetical protein KIT32_12210 [Rhodocyclaceae bacterium]|nr:hypothetical protein [Rhodocyclaceae bacterium]
MAEWQPFRTAPRDGTIVELRSDDEGPFEMYWDPSAVNPLVGMEPGLWVLRGGGMTWCDRAPRGAPTEWRRPSARTYISKNVYYGKRVMTDADKAEHRKRLKRARFKLPPPPAGGDR